VLHVARGTITGISPPPPLPFNAACGPLGYITTYILVPYTPHNSTHDTRSDSGGDGEGLIRAAEGARAGGDLRLNNSRPSICYHAPLLSFSSSGCYSMLPAPEGGLGPVGGGDNGSRVTKLVGDDLGVGLGVALGVPSTCPNRDLR